MNEKRAAQKEPFDVWAALGQAASCEREVEARTDTYAMINSPTIGVKLRGRRKGALLEVKKRVATAELSAQCVAERWDKVRRQRGVRVEDVALTCPEAKGARLVDVRKRRVQRQILRGVCVEQVDIVVVLNGDEEEDEAWRSVCFESAEEEALLHRTVLDAWALLLARTDGLVVGGYPAWLIALSSSKKA